MTIFNKVILTREVVTPVYSIILTPAAVNVNSLLGTVTPNTEVKAVAYRHVADQIYEATDGTMRCQILYRDKSYASVATDTVEASKIADAETVTFQYEVDRTVVARETLQIGRTGNTYKPVRIQLWDDVAPNSRLYPGYADTDPWTDIVFTVNGSAQTYYKCVREFARTSGAMPSAYVTSGHLISAADYTVIATQVLLAQNAVINLLQGNKIMVSAGGDVTAGMQGVASGVQIWGGSSDPDTAPFRVLHDGSIVATKADILGKIAASILDLRVSSGDTGLPDGAICFDRGSITLPELDPGAVRTIKVLNPPITRNNPTNLKLIPQNANVYIATDLNYLDATSSTKEIAAAGPNGNKYYELLGIRRANTDFTVWLTREL